MAGAYSADLRERTLLACARGKLSRAKVAALFRLGESTLYRWLGTWRTEGRREAKPHAGGPEPRLDAAALDELKAIVAEANDLSLAEHAPKLQERAGVTVSGPTVSRALKKLGLPRKKAPLSTNWPTHLKGVETVRWGTTDGGRPAWCAG
jgi:transposase